LRWYALTGGVDGPVLFTTFEQRKSLSQVLDQLGLLFNAALQKSGIDWQTLTDLAEKRDLTLQILRQVPVLWIWDNVEPIAGFPAGTPSAWTAAEQRELADFLRAARNTKAKFLLTSRRAEQAWLGDLPLRVALPPMPMHERRQLAEALAAKYSVVLDQAIWRPLLAYSEGNPLTLTVVLGQALRAGWRTAPQIAAYVQRLRAGEAVLDADKSEGRSRSLHASLSYGFERAFNEQERAILALLHHFQGFVDVAALIWMGEPTIGNLPELAGLTREADIALLDRATEVGLLTALGGGYYRIHPALPWFFRQLYVECYGEPATKDEGRRTEDQASELPHPQSLVPNPTHAYVEAISALGDYYHRQYNEGNRGVIAALRAEEANLLHARRLAQTHSWYGAIISAMQGLRSLYGHTGRRAEWRALVAEIVPAFVDPKTDGPLPGREEDWGLVTEYRVRLLREQRQWADAASLQALRVVYNRQQAAPLLAVPPKQLDSDQRNTLRSLAASLHELGQIQREQGAPACVASYQESHELALRIGDHAVAASCAFNLGNAYLGNKVLALRDLTQAEQWYQRSLELRTEQDRLGRGRVQGQLGKVAYERYKEAQQAKQPGEVLVQHLNAAQQFYQQMLDLTPSDAMDSLAVAHNMLGTIYSEAGVS
jgi:hypothetical protein